MQTIEVRIHAKLKVGINSQKKINFLVQNAKYTSKKCPLTPTKITFLYILYLSNFRFYLETGVPQVLGPAHGKIYKIIPFCEKVHNALISLKEAQLYISLNLTLTIL